MSTDPFVIHSFETKEQTTQEAGKIITQILQDFLQQPILLLASGGSALDIFKYIHFPERADTLTLSVVDERYSSDPLVNNFAQLAALDFFQPFMVSGGKSIDTRLAGEESLLDVANRFEWALRQWKRDNALGKVVVILGMGSDGHTSGVMPYPEDPQVFGELFDDTALWVVGYDAGVKNRYPLRITTTLSFLREAVDVALVFVVGEEKQTMFEKFLTTDDVLCAMPIQIVKKMRQSVIVTDRRVLIAQKRDVSIV
jgi:6-phosphogluconolactonase/glucosamine-6-phosphate isomerase/deaminase